MNTLSGQITKEAKDSVVSNLKKIQDLSYGILRSPFDEAFLFGASIDYKTNPESTESDHSYVKKLGYKPEMSSDCSYYAKGLKGFSLSSYGDWGTYFVDWGDTATHNMFLDMVEKQIIIPWRVRAYLRVTNETVTYNYDERGWRRYTGKEWVESEDPFEWVASEVPEYMEFLKKSFDNSKKLF